MHQGMSAIRLDEDHHVHSTFSDGTTSIAENIVVAGERGLRKLGCVDHVRRDSAYLPSYVAAVRAARSHTDIALTIGIEAKILNDAGALDLPADITGVEVLYVADHQFPGETGPLSPRQMRASLADGARTAGGAVQQLVRATAGALRTARTVHVAGAEPAIVVAHLFSIVPKLGLDESCIPDSDLGELVDAMLETSAILEVSERWKCPSERVVRAAHARGVSIVASTDSHRAADIGRYNYVAALAAGMHSAAASTR